MQGSVPRHGTLFRINTLDQDTIEWIHDQWIGTEAQIMDSSTTFRFRSSLNLTIGSRSYSRTASSPIYVYKNDVDEWERKEGSAKDAMENAIPETRQGFADGDKRTISLVQVMIVRPAFRDGPSDDIIIEPRSATDRIIAYTCVIRDRAESSATFRSCRVKSPQKFGSGWPGILATFPSTNRVSL